jgi:hypothetical protein
LEKFTPLPDLLSPESLSAAGATFFASADKARRELDWETRELEEGLEETLTWIAYTSHEPWLFVSRERQLAGLSLATALVLFLAWLISRRRS